MIQVILKDIFLSLEMDKEIIEVVKRYPIISSEEQIVNDKSLQLDKNLLIEYKLINTTRQIIGLELIIIYTLEKRPPRGTTRAKVYC